MGFFPQRKEKDKACPSLPVQYFDFPLIFLIKNPKKSLPGEGERIFLRAWLAWRDKIPVLTPIPLPQIPVLPKLSLADIPRTRTGLKWGKSGEEIPSQRKKLPLLIRISGNNSSPVPGPAAGEREAISPPKPWKKMEFGVFWGLFF